MRVFRKSVEKFRVELKSDKNSRYCTRRRFDIYDNISMNYSSNEKRFRQNCIEDQDTYFMFNNMFPKIVPFMR